jgi:uncharacterized protein (DUF1015 family)
MPEIRPFRGVRYDADQVGSMSSVIAPPYDIVSPEMRARLADASPHSVIQLELPQPAGGRDAYENAAHLFREWLTGDVLVRGAMPALYPYTQTFCLPSGEERIRTGVLALMRLHEYDEGVVLPHEETLPKAKEDRFRLLSAARAQFSPIFGIYDPGERAARAWLDEAMKADPVIDVVDGEQPFQRVQAATAVSEDVTAEQITRDDSVRHRVWIADHPALIEGVAGALAPLPVFIVDGHHRYETALRYRREHGAGEPWADYIMIYLVAMDDPGLVVFPTHRIVTGRAGTDWEAARHQLARHFDFDTHPLQLPIDPVRIAAAVTDSLSHGTLAMLAPPFNRVERLVLRDPTAVDQRASAGRPEVWRRLDVVALHELVLGEALGVQETRGESSGVSYTRDAVEAVEAVMDRPDRAAFFVPAPTVEDVRQVALGGAKMPEKSTYFWPKAISGLVIYDQFGIMGE